MPIKIPTSTITTVPLGARSRAYDNRIPKNTHEVDIIIDINNVFLKPYPSNNADKFGNTRSEDINKMPANFIDTITVTAVMVTNK